MGPRSQPVDEEVEEEMEEARALAEQERTLAAQQQASDLTTDFRSVYGPRKFSIFNGMS